MSIDNELIKGFASRFINHAGAYYQQWANGTEFGYGAIYQPVTYELIKRHLAGTVTLALPGLDENNHGRWICFDSDTENGALNKLESFLRQHHWHVIREGKRSGRDGHLWILLNESIAGEYLCSLAKAMIKLAGLSSADIEIFPKQPQANKLASGIRLPLGIHRKPGAGCRGLFECCAAKDIESQLTWLINQPLNDANTAIELAELHALIELPPIKPIRKNRNGNYERINILDYVQVRRFGKELAGQCPVCKAEGHDKHRDNLRINSDGTKFACMYGGAAKVHRGGDIIRALLLASNK